VFSLKITKITEWQGRILKLFPGIFLFSFGVVMIIDYQLLQGNNLILLLFLIGFDVLLTALIALIWRHRKGKISEPLTPELQKSTDKKE